MGYRHDTGVAQWLPPGLAHFATGTWTDAAGQVAGTIVKKKSAADETATLTIPIKVPSNSGTAKGSRVASIDIYFEILTAALDALTAAISLLQLPADGAAIAALTDVAFTYDTGHDTAAERIDIDQHKMTLTITTPFWLKNDQVLQVALTIDAAATSVFDYIGSRMNFTARD